MSDVFVNQQAEMAVLGAAVKDAESARKIARLSTDLFHDPRSLILLEAIRGTEAAGQTIDLVTLSAQAEKQGNASNTDFIVECVRACSAPSMYPEYVKLLEGCAARRKLYEIGTEIRKQVSDATLEPDEIRQWAARTIKETQVQSGQALIGMPDALLKTFAQIEDDHKREDGGDRIMSGIKTLDERLGGLRGGLYVAIGARPGVGKSILALQYCAAAAKSGKRALLISLEMDEVQLTQRLLASDSGVPLRSITGAPLSAGDWMKISESLTVLASKGLWYSTDANTVEKVRSAAYQLYENGGLDLLAVDYLQLMDATYSKRNGRQEQISEISRGLRKLAAELKIPILVLTQLNRSNVKEKIDGRTVKREPTMSDARESGSIEQDANIFMLLHEPGFDEMPSEHAKATFQKVKARGMKVLKIIIDKNRQGKNGRLDVAFDGDHMSFYPLNDLTEE